MMFEMPGEHQGTDHATGAHRCASFLRTVPILFEVDDVTIHELASFAEERTFEPGERVLSQGASEDADAGSFYVIRSGSADVQRRDRSGHDRVIARLSIGSYFGELGLLTNQARNATVQVHGDVPLVTYAFDALTFHRRIAEHVLAFRVLRDRGSTSSLGRPGMGQRLSIKGLDVLQRMPEHDLEFILRSAEQRWHPTRAPIIRQGDPGDRFYVVLTGEVEVVRDGSVVATLGESEFFGETALLLDTPRNATVRAASHVLTWSISRVAFQRLVGSYLLANPRTQGVIMRRMKSALPDQIQELPKDDDPSSGGAG